MVTVSVSHASGWANRPKNRIPKYTSLFGSNCRRSRGDPSRKEAASGTVRTASNAALKISLLIVRASRSRRETNRHRVSGKRKDFRLPEDVQVVLGPAECFDGS